MNTKIKQFSLNLNFQPKKKYILNAQLSFNFKQTNLIKMKSINKIMPNVVKNSKSTMIENMR